MELDDGSDAENRRSVADPDVVGIREAAQLAGVHPNTLISRIREGAFPEARRDPNGRGHPWRLSKSVVLEMGPAVRKRTPRQERIDIEGELAAAAFQMFEDAVEPVQIVIRLKAQPAAIMKLHDQWLALRARSHVATSVAPATAATPATPVKEIDWRTVE